VPLTVSIPFDAATLQALYPVSAVRHRVRLAANQSLRRGTVLAELVSAPGAYRAYVPGGAGGLDVPKVILESDCATDALGKVNLGTLVVGASPMAVTYDDAWVFVGGDFRCEDLVGLDEDAARVLGRLIEGTLEQGVFCMTFTPARMRANDVFRF
jgi:hypothetical protein